VASDQFAFCVSLYECVSGRLPFEVRELEGRLTEVRVGPAPLTATGLNRRVELALRRGLSFEPAARWPSMAALRDELQTALEAPRRRQTVVGGGVLGLVSMGLFGLSVAQSRARCDSADAPVKAVWTKTRADTVSTAFLATKHPAADVLSTKVVQALGNYADSLSAMRTRACRATAFEGESDALLTLRQTCGASLTSTPS